MGYSNGVLSVKSTCVDIGSITSTKRRKRQLQQLRAVVFCNPTQAGSIVSKTVYCFTQCVTEIKTDIQSKFESTSFTIVTNLGSHIGSSQFYAFVQVVPDEQKINQKW
ncbi:unnamed protein product [Adineta steineri]|uniref:Uncharacterized protein n=1 Tax=Adineta steineri TaxID=433720 RepID=A0A815JAI6_9BILA|nr:unnamed protein product [Adineta steineri]